MWHLYLVETPVATFFGVARTEHEAANYFGADAKLTEIPATDEGMMQIIRHRAEGMAAHVVFIAI